MRSSDSRTARRWRASASSRSRVAGQTGRLRQPGSGRASCFWWKAIRPAFRKTGAHRVTQAIMPLRGKIPEHWGADIGEVCNLKRCTTSALRSAVDPAASDLSDCFTKICIWRTPTHGQHMPRCGARCFLRHYARWCCRPYLRVHAPLFRIVPEGSDLRARRSGAREDAERMPRESPHKPVVTRFKGLGEMSPWQLRETRWAADTRLCNDHRRERQPGSAHGHALAKSARRSARVAREQRQPRAKSSACMHEDQ